jgi:peptidoglycan/xylan/chitin deacetylase (PgdA/CDA1 family)
MLKYQKIIALSVLLLLILMIVDYYVNISIWIYIGIIIATIALLAYGSASVGSGFYCSVICSADTNEKIIALTFDDGPDKILTPLILDILARNDVKAAFFCVGDNVKANPDVVRRIDREGHIIGNHSGTHHFFFDLFSRKRMIKELEGYDDIVGNLIRRKVKLFRPPYGVTNPALAAAAAARDYSVIGWSLKSMDTVIKNENDLLQRLEKKLKNGDIILFHDTMEITAHILDRFIGYARGQNYRFERIDHLLKINAYE